MCVIRSCLSSGVTANTQTATNAILYPLALGHKAPADSPKIVMLCSTVPGHKTVCAGSPPNDPFDGPRQCFFNNITFLARSAEFFLHDFGRN